MKPDTHHLDEIQEQLRLFRDQRDWAQFHSLKNLVAAISVEAAELQELFLWATGADEEALVLDEMRPEIQAELADVLIQCLNFANSAGIDAGAAIDAKIDGNASKYPVDKSRGRATKYTDL